MEENRIPKKVSYINLETMRLRGRPRNRWQDDVTEDGRLVGGKGWKERFCNREEWKKLLRTARNRCILHIPMEWMNEWMNKRMNEWTNEWMNERMNEWTNEWTNEWMNEWMNERMNERTNEWMNEILLLFSLFTCLDPKLSTVFLIVVPQMCYVRVNWKISSEGM